METDPSEHEAQREDPVGDDADSEGVEEASDSDLGADEPEADPAGTDEAPTGP